jgi:uncharacterized Tic20 family protein
MQHAGVFPLDILGSLLPSVVLGLLAGGIAAVVGARKKQSRLGREGFLACTLSGIIFPLIPPIPVAVCAVFVWLMAKFSACDLSQAGRSALQTRATGIVSVMVLAGDILVLLCVAFIVAFSAPAFREIYMDFDVQLPLITRVILFGPALAFLLSFAFVIAALVVKEIIMVKKTTALIINVLAGFGIQSIFATCVLALYLPIFTLGEAINGLS